MTGIGSDACTRWLLGGPRRGGVVACRSAPETAGRTAGHTLAVRWDPPRLGRLHRACRREHDRHPGRCGVCCDRPGPVETSDPLAAAGRGSTLRRDRALEVDSSASWRSPASLSRATILNGRRSVPGLVAMASGIALALSYDAWQASRIGRSLTDFLVTARATSSTGWTVVLRLGGRARTSRVARPVDPTGDRLRPPSRTRARGGHSTTDRTGRCGSVGLSPGPCRRPIGADGGTFYPFDGSVLGLVAWLVLAAAIGSAPFLALDDPIDRRVHVALLVWLAPTTVVWAYAPCRRGTSPCARLGPSRPAVGCCTRIRLGRPGEAAARRLRRPGSRVLLLAVTTAPSIDGLGSSGWCGLLDLGWSGWTDRAQTENYAWGPFSYVVNLTRENVTGSQRIVTSDGRLQYFFPGQVEASYARTCSELEAARFFSSSRPARASRSRKARSSRRIRSRGPSAPSPVCGLSASSRESMQRSSSDGRRLGPLRSRTATSRSRKESSSTRCSEAT